MGETLDSVKEYSRILWHETRIEIGVNDLLYAIALSETELDVPC